MLSPTRQGAVLGVAAVDAAGECVGDVVGDPQVSCQVYRHGLCQVSHQAMCRATCLSFDHGAATANAGDLGSD